MKIEYWVKNNTESDLVSSELKLKIEHGKPRNLCALNPNLGHEDLQNSEECGFLRRCFDSGKLIKLPFAPPRASYSTQAPSTFASAPMPSRVKTSVVMDPASQDFIEELSHFEEDIQSDRFADGFVDILADGPMAEVTLGEGNAEFDGKPFASVTIKPKDSEKHIDLGSSVKTRPVERKIGGKTEIVIETIE